MNWYVYIAKAKTGYYYTGITTDPKQRILKHNSGMGSQMARQQGPFELIYISNIFSNYIIQKTPERVFFEFL